MRRLVYCSGGIFVRSHAISYSEVCRAPVDRATKPLKGRAMSRRHRVELWQDWAERSREGERNLGSGLGGARVARVL
jgi:hypothetical protein